MTWNELTIPNILPPEHPLGEFSTVTELLESPDSWCQGTNFRDSKGGEVLNVNKTTKCCLEGACAIFLINPNSIRPSNIEAVLKFNDTHTHAEVLALCKQLGI